MVPEKKELRLSLTKVEKVILNEEKLLHDIKKQIEHILVKLVNLVYTNARQLEELSALDIAGIPRTSKTKVSLLTLINLMMSFNLQYLQLQQAMQAENRQFTMVSNIMKSKHDTAKNSINNLR